MRGWLMPFCAGAWLCSMARADSSAVEIARRALLSNVVPVEGKSLFVAGGHQFHDLWIRDFAMSVGGLLAISREDGLLPRVIDNEDITARTILGGAFGQVQGFSAPLKGWFETENGVLVIDGNAAIPWAASRYLRATGDLDSARRWYPAMERALDFLETRFVSDGLVASQPPYSDWEDSVARKGRVAFTNELYLLALRGASQWSRMLGWDDRAAAYEGQALRVEAAFLAQFWDNDRGRILNYEGDGRWSADANFMAAARGLVSPGVARRVLASWPAALWKPLPATTWPDYPSESKDEIVKLVGLADYHDRLYWLWLGALAAMAEREAGDCAAYERLMGAISRIVERDGAVYEVYELADHGSDLRPVKRPLYQAEHPFSWSAAYLLEASQGGCAERRPGSLFPKAEK